MDNKVAHERLWELSKAKKMNMPIKKTFDEQLDDLQECTFQPNLQKTNRGLLSRKRSQENDMDQKYIKGYEETIDRLKKGKALKDEKKKQFEK